MSPRGSVWRRIVWKQAPRFLFPTCFSCFSQAGVTRGYLKSTTKVTPFNSHQKGPLTLNQAFKRRASSTVSGTPSRWFLGIKSWRNSEMGIYFKIPSFRLVILEWEGMGNLHWVSLLRLMTENGSTMSTMPKFALIIKVFIIAKLLVPKRHHHWTSNLLKLKSDTCKQSPAATYISVCIYIRYMYINAYMHVSYTFNAYTHSLQSSSAVTAGSSGTGVARWRQPGRWSSMTFVHHWKPVKFELGNGIWNGNVCWLKGGILKWWYPQ